MSPEAWSEIGLTVVIAATWGIDKVLYSRQSHQDRLQLAELIQNMNKHFDDKIEDIKEDLEEVEELLEDMEDRNG